VGHRVVGFRQQLAELVSNALVAADALLIVHDSTSEFGIRNSEFGIPQRVF
jgi:hypothetical protein